MIERRKSVRVECEVAVAYRDLDSPNPAKVTVAVGKNISRGGIKIQVDVFVPIQDRLHITIELPTHRIEANAHPAWIVEIPNIGKYEIGARFVDIRPEDEDAIQSFQYHSLLEKMPFRPNVVKDLLKDNPHPGDTRL